MIKAIIFDKDGVIIDSEKIHIDSVTQAMKELWITIGQQEQNYIVGKHPDHYQDYLLQKYTFPIDRYRKRQKEIYYKLIESANLFEDTINLIKKFKKKWYLLALTTSSSKKNADITLKMAWLNNIFDVIITKEDTSRWKPNPDPYLATAKRLKVNSKECIVFEDSNVGVQSAKNAGMKCIAIPNKYTKDHDLSQADLIITNRNNIRIDIINTI